MKHRPPIVSIALVSVCLASLLPGLPALAQKTTAPEPPDDGELDSWIESLGAPGEGHEVLESMVGTWEGKGSIWDGPASDSIPITATVERHWVLGGRFLREQVEVRIGSGEVFESLGFIGFNNEAAQYELLTIDNASTAMLLETGKFDPDSETLMIRGSYRDPATGFVIERRVEMDLSKEGRISVVGYSRNEDGREYKSLEGTVTRRKQP